MKRIAFYSVIAAALVASCSTQEKDIQTPIRDDVIFYASFERPAEDDTKVYANEDLLLRWTANDRVSIFNKNTYNQQYMFIGQTGDFEGGFNKVDDPEFITGQAIPHVISVYPFQRQTRVSEEEVITVSLPAVQHYAHNSFGLGDNTMVSVSSGNLLQYRSVSGFLVISLYGEGMSVNSIKLRGNNGERIAGDATVTMPLDGMPTVTMANDAATEITLTCQNPIKLGATAEESTQFWFVVPPVIFEKGFSIKVAGSGYCAISTEKVLTIERNKRSKMSPIELALHPSNTIYYTSTDRCVVTPNNTDGFGANLVSNEYVNGLGVLMFDGDVTSIGKSAFANCDKLLTISLPNNVSSIGQYAFVNCIKLKTVDIPGSVKSIEHSAFSCCHELKSIIFPEGIEAIEKYTCLGCIGLTSVVLPESVREIKGSAFEGCQSLQSISLPTKLERINSNAFSGTGLSSVHIPNSVTYLAEGSFMACKSLDSFSGKYTSFNGKYLIDDGVLLAVAFNGVKDYVVPSDVIRIGAHTFGCSDIESISIPSNVTSIGDGAVSFCYSLESVSLLNPIPPTGGEEMFYETNNCPIYVLTGSVEEYKTAQYWREYADRIQAIPSPSVLVPEAINLGLSVMWASFNLGASKPEEYGDYYAWGETEPYYISQGPLIWKEGKSEGYAWFTYKWCRGANNTLTKYCYDSEYGYSGFTDTKIDLDPEDDVAHVNLGGNWRMPTAAEWEELLSNCTWTWTQENGINGRKVTSKKNGISIFLPAAGYRLNTSLGAVGSIGNYWSSSLGTDSPSEAKSVGFGSGAVYGLRDQRYFGFSVRPVYAE